MALFNASKYRRSSDGFTTPRIESKFKRFGGRLPLGYVDERVSQVPLSPREKEYIKQVIAKYNYPGSQGITRKEFRKALEEMARNEHDSVTREEVKRIKKYF